MATEQVPGTSMARKIMTSKAQSVDESVGIRRQRKVSGIYTKHTSASGTFQNGKPKLQRQFSTSSLTIPSGPNTRRTSIVIDPEKFEAAKKRRQDSLLKKELQESESANLESTNNSCKSRLKLCTTILVSVLLILSCSSLLFICLLIVDPIIVGLRADFKTDPGICRIAFIEEGKGPSNCSVPTCREGCTTDLFFCTFIRIIYYEYSRLNNSFASKYFREELIDSEVQTFSDKVHEELELSFLDNELNNNSYNNTSTKFQKKRFYNGTLMINPNGCGYAPTVNCTEFIEKYNEPDKTFPCFYSSSLYSNEVQGVAIPFYDRNEEMTLLGLYLGIPLGLVVFFLLFLLLIIYCSRNTRKAPDKINLLEKEEEESETSIFSKSKKHLELSQHISLESNGNGNSSSHPTNNYFHKKINGHTHTSRDNT